jgi:hypothetical protein
MIPDQFKGIKFIESVSRIKAKKNESKNKKGVKYCTVYNDHHTVRDFVREIKALLFAFKYELLMLPLIYSIAGNRQAFINHLHEHLFVVFERLKEYETFLKKDFPYISHISSLSEKDIFPRFYSKENHPTEIDYENHKIHYIHFYHKYIVYRAIEEIETYSLNEGFVLNGVSLNGKEPPAITTQFHFKTDLSVDQLALLFQILTDLICKDLNKTELAKFLSSTFQTTRSNHPSFMQIKKAFYEVDEHTQQVVKGLILDMLKRVQQSKR